MVMCRANKYLWYALLFASSATPVFAAEAILLKEVEALPLSVRYVNVCGGWKSEAGEGYHRVIAMDVFGGAGSELYVQWVLPATQAQDAKVIETVSVRELNNDHAQYSFESVDCKTVRQRTTVNIRASFEHDENDEVHHISVRLLNVGKYQLLDRITKPQKKR